MNGGILWKPFPDGLAHTDKQATMTTKEKREIA